MLRSDLCDYSDAYIVVKRIMSVTGTNAKNRITDYIKNHYRLISVDLSR